ncbi:MAG: rhodanese-like domain-containing protein [Burkholderiaceae bacterium]
MIAQIRPRDLAHWLDEARAIGEPVVLDVREPSELLRASVTPSDFKLVAIPMGSIPGRLDELPATQPIACLCHHGARSMQVATFLHSRGFAHVANIAGGIDAWSEELDPAVARY